MGRFSLHGIFALIASLSLISSGPVRAQTPDQGGIPDSGAPGQGPSSGSNTAGSNDQDWVHAWMRIVDQTRASQPHFISPIVTTHVLLVQQYRYDMSWQRDSSGGTITSNYG